MERRGGQWDNPSRRGGRGLLAVLLALTLIGAACSGGNDDTGAADDAGADGATGDGTGGDGTTAVDASLELVDPTGESLFPCQSDSGSDVVVAYLDTDASASGVNAERMRGVVGDYNRRCGTRIELVPHVQAAGAEAAACEAPLEAAPVLTIASDPSIDAVACFVDAGAVVWSEGPLVRAVMDDAETLVVATERPSDSTAELQVRLLDGEGLIEGRAFAVVHHGIFETTAIADAFVEALERAGASATVTDVGPGCDGAADAALATAVVVTIVEPSCVFDLARAATTAGSTPEWIVFDHRRSIADDAVDFTPVERSFDVALAYSASPAIGGGWPRVLDPHARDAACLTYLDELLGTETAYPSVAWHTGARLCSTAHALFQLLAAAGPSPDAAAVEGALDSVTDVPFPRGQRGGFSATEPWIGPAQLFALEWSADCGCWTHVAGPLAAG